MSHIYHPTALILVVLLLGCAPLKTPETVREHAEDRHPSYHREKNLPERPFDDETLYDLLVAEFAGIRGQLDVALNYYIHQSRETRDPAVAERASHIAAFLNSEKLLDIALLRVEIEPDNIEARALAAQALGRAGRPLEALEQSTYLLFKGSEESILNLPSWAEHAGREEREQLIERLSQLLEELPDNRSLLLSRTLLRQQQGLLQDALADAKRLLRLQPKDESSLLLVARLQHGTGDRNLALKTLTKGLKGNPRSQKLRLQYARYLAATDLNASRGQLEVLLDQNPGDPGLVYTLSLVNLELGLKTQAIEQLLSLSNDNRFADDARWQLGNLAEQDNHIIKALNYYRGVREGAYFLPAAYRVANLLIESGKTDEAWLYLQRLRARHPERAVELYQMESELLINLEKLERAYALLGDGLDEFPNEIRLLYARSMIGEKQKDIVRIETNLRAILQKDADNATALNALGYALTNLSTRYEEAHELIHRALAIEPDDPAIIDSMGWVLYRLGRYDEALAKLKLAIEGMPDPEVAAHLGEVLWITGEKQRAIEIWQQGMEKQPDNPIIRETMKRLQATTDGIAD